MMARETHLSGGDIDPGWYPGHPELLAGELEGEKAQQPQGQQQGEGEQQPQHSQQQQQRLHRHYHPHHHHGHHHHHSQQQQEDAGEGGSGDAAAGGHAGAPAVPTVLTKLQKWGDYDSVGAQVLPSKFIPMKTPLSAEILDSWSLPSQPKHRLTVPEMLSQQSAQGRQVGLLLDLSNHDCLYAADIPAGLRYLHIQLVAKELPPQDYVDAVVAAANAFWEAHPEEYIAVHCAYGFNRTGFVVCCYLIEVHGLSVEDALAAFADSRPPGVKHEQFRNELHRRYGNGSPRGYGAFGSPDDNSSFGCSPSCGSLDLCGGGALPSPLPSCGGTGLDGSAGGGSPVASFINRRSSDGFCGMGRHERHQTLTFMSSASATAVVSEYRRSSGSGGGVWLQQRHAHQLAFQQLRRPSHEEHEGQLECHKEREEEEQQQQEEGNESSPQQDGRHLGHARDGPSSQIVAGSGRAGEPQRQQAQGDRAQEEQAGAAAAGAASEDEDSAGGGQQPQSYENESLGVNDRYILQKLRQHALARNSTIAEESCSYHSTPVRGCSSSSLADSAGQRTPPGMPPGSHTARHIYKSLESIDWAAAAGDDGKVAEPEPRAPSSGDSAEPLVGNMASLKLE